MKGHNATPICSEIERRYASALRSNCHEPEFLQLKFLYLCVSEIHLQKECTGQRGCQFIPLHGKHTVLCHLKQLFFQWIQRQYPELKMPDFHGEKSDYARLHRFFSCVSKANRLEEFSNDTSLNSMLATLSPFITDEQGNAVYDICGSDQYIYSKLHQKTRPQQPYVRLGGDLHRKYFSLDCRYFDMRGVDLHNTYCFHSDYQHHAQQSFKPPSEKELMAYHVDFSHADLRGADLRGTQLLLKDAILDIQYDATTHLKGCNLLTLQNGHSRMLNVEQVVSKQNCLLM